MCQGLEEHCQMLQSLLAIPHKHKQVHPPPSLQKAVTTSPYSQATLELNASGQISVLSPLSTQVPVQASLYVEATLGEPITALGIEELLLYSS